jgi:hypothetical protein
MPKRGEKNVLPSGIVTARWRAQQTAIGLSLFAAVSDSEKPLEFFAAAQPLTPHRVASREATVHDLCPIVGTMPGGGLSASLKRISICTSAPRASR